MCSFHVHIKGASAEGLDKRQHTAHVFINDWELEGTFYGYIDLTYRGKEQGYQQLRRHHTTNH